MPRKSGSTTSQKHRDFLEPIGKKPVTKLAGIGETLGGRLSDAGYDKASSVLGQYLVLQQDEMKFKGWMKDVCNASSKQSDDCYKCLNDWSKEFL
ncbi:hypothetical protein ACLKA6_001364 [Drosophila palustris]